MAAVIEAQGLSKRFGDTLALDDVSFAVEGPGLMGILGPNGAGKTTLLDILQGLSKPSAGSFRLFGNPPTPYPRQRVGVVMQQELRLERVTVGEYAALFAAIYAVKGDTIVADAQLAGRVNVPMDKLSGGEAARLFIACASAHQPQLLFLDEPTAHLDPQSKRTIGELLCDIAKTRCVVMTTHDLREANVLCDQLLFLVNGQLRAVGSRAQLLAAVPAAQTHDPEVEDAFFHFCAARLRDGKLEREGDGR